MLGYMRTLILRSRPKGGVSKDRTGNWVVFQQPARARRAPRDRFGAG